MKIDELPEELRGLVIGLKEGSSTIECCVNDALEFATDMEGFRESVSCEMDSLIDEAHEVSITIGNTKPVGGD